MFSLTPIANREKKLQLFSSAWRFGAFDSLDVSRLSRVSIGAYEVTELGKGVPSETTFFGRNRKTITG